MSDDGYYEYDPEYEEFTDMLYEADANPDLADDLAGRATYSPVWQDDVAEELRDYFSDWEYYSDDYFDDDPALLKPTAGVKEVTKQSKKRKATDEVNGPAPKRRNIDALTACLRGTVWKGESPEPPTKYSKGMVKPVALKLPKEVMDAAYNRGASFGRASRHRDESWANDLSLADMGLKTERSTSIHESIKVDGIDEEDEDLMSQAVEDEDEDVAEDEILAEPESFDQQTNPQEHSATQEIDDRPRKRKRQHLNGNDSPGPEIEVQTAPAKQEMLENMHQAVNGSVTVNGTTRKRKLSNETSATSSTASSRAKRLDNKTTIVQSKSITTTAASTRPSRKTKS